MVDLHFPQRNMLTYYLYFYSRMTSGWFIQSVKVIQKCSALAPMQHLESKEYLKLSDKCSLVRVQYLPPQRSGLDKVWQKMEIIKQRTSKLYLSTVLE